jgi:hypothetical protein
VANSADHQPVELAVVHQVLDRIEAEGSTCERFISPSPIHYQRGTLPTGAGSGRTRVHCSRGVQFHAVPPSASNPLRLKAISMMAFYSAATALARLVRISLPRLHFLPDAMKCPGELRLRLGQAELAEADLREAIAMAQKMSAKAFELRATTPLARLLRDN